MAETEESLNGNLATRPGPPVKSGTDHRTTVSLVVGVKPYRYMFEKITEKAEGNDVSTMEILTPEIATKHPFY